MKRILTIVVALAAVTSVVMAQGGGGGGRAGGFGGQRGFGAQNGGPTMLNREDVATELKLTADQKTKIQEAIQASRPQGGGAGAGGGGGAGNGGGGNGAGGAGGGGGRGGGFGGRGNLPPEAQIALDTKLKGILDATQYARYRELSRQQAGGFALRQEVEAKDLGLSADQRAQIETINTAMGEEMRGMFQGGAGGGGGGGGADFTALQEQMTKMRKTYGDKMLAVLTKEQKAKWDASLGKPFKFTQPGG